MSDFPFIPFNDQVIVQYDVADDVSPGGIIIPDQAKSVLQTATVIAVGPGGVLPDGSRHEMSAKVGQKIYVKKFAGHKIEVEGESYHVMAEDQILGVLRNG